MSESKQKKNANQKFNEKFPLCALCGGLRSTTSREHCPPRALFVKKHRPNGFEAPSCQECQEKTRTADLVVSIISRWAYAPDADTRIEHAVLAHRLKSQAPNVVNEWTGLSLAQRKEGRRYLDEQGLHSKIAGIVGIGKQTIPYLNLFSYKFALVSYFIETGKILTKGGLVWASWRTKEDIENWELPKLLDDHVGYAKTLRQGEWDASVNFEYRNGYNATEGAFGILARFNSSFFVAAFAVEQAGGRTEDQGWFSPETALEKANCPHRWG